VPFEVVPGVSSLSAVPAAAGIPITHRGISSQVTMVQGHGPIDFGALAHLGGTIVLFMALGRLAEIAEGLLAHGLASQTPAAVIASGTTSAQEVVTAPLERIAEAATGLRPPALVVVGDVVALSAWLASARGTLAAA